MKLTQVTHGARIRKFDGDCINIMQPKNQAMSVVSQVIVAAARFLVDFNEYVRRGRQLDMIVSGNSPNEHQPVVHQIRDSGLKDVRFGDDSDSSLLPIESVALSLWVNRHCPSLSLVGRPCVRYEPQTSQPIFGNRLAHTNPNVVPKGMVVEETLTLNNEITKAL
jgi:hypothetical protein